MYYPCSENKGADQFGGYREADLRLCFRLCRLLVFPWDDSIMYTQNVCESWVRLQAHETLNRGPVSIRPFLLRGTLNTKTTSSFLRFNFESYILTVSYIKLNMGVSDLYHLVEFVRFNEPVTF